MDEVNINPIAEQLVNQNINDSNTNGVPGSVSGETKAETVARLYKVNVDGQEMEVDENELRRGYAHNKAASKRMEEAAYSRKEAEQVITLFKNNPKEAFRLLGGNARQFAEQIINEELQDAMLSPEQKELRHYRKQVEQHETNRRQSEEQEQQREMQAQIDQQADTIQSEIVDVLQNSGIPKTERTVSRIIYYMQSALTAGYNVTPKDVIDQVKQDYKADLNSMLGGLSDEDLEAYLGTEITRKVAKSSVKKATNMGKVSPTVNNTVVKKDPNKKIMSPRDFFKNN
jgi:hypothetical protein